jgi:hypothetical protein
VNIYLRLTSMATLGAVKFHSHEDRKNKRVRQGAAVSAQKSPALAARDRATQAYIADLQLTAAVSAGYVARMGSSDPVVRAAAHTEWGANARTVCGPTSTDRGQERA